MDDVTEGSERVAAIRGLWTEGDYARIGELFAPISEQVVAELDEELGLAGRTVLDAATGTGNTALALARRGARVSAFDLTPRLLAVTRHRADGEGLPLELLEGDLCAIPFPDDRFDVVVSTFGAFLADDQRRCAVELVRVCRPGGWIVSTAWTNDGFLAVLRETVLDRYPELNDASLPDAAAWAERAPLEEIFAGLDVSVDVERRHQSFRFAGCEAAMALLEDASGPVQRLRSRVSEVGGDWEELRDEVIQQWQHASTPVDGGVELTGVYGIARISVTG